VGSRKEKVGLSIFSNYFGICTSLY